MCGVAELASIGEAHPVLIKTGLPLVDAVTWRCWYGSILSFRQLKSTEGELLLDKASISRALPMRKPILPVWAGNIDYHSMG